MYADMRHFVVFRLPQKIWENGPLTSGDLADWIDANTDEGNPPVKIGETDFEFYYLIIGFSASHDANALREYLRRLPFVQTAFDSNG